MPGQNPTVTKTVFGATRGQFQTQFKAELENITEQMLLSLGSQGLQVELWGKQSK
jgi:hypothetical protein